MVKMAVMVLCAALVSGCGDASRDEGSSDATTPDTSVVADGAEPDAATGDAPLGFDVPPADTDREDVVVVDGGTECDAAPKAGSEVRTCCNGAACDGYCALVGADGGAACYCAGVVGGCPAPMVCCPVKENTCVSVCSKGV